MGMTTRDERMARAIERLTERERLVFTYSAYERLEDHEIAALFGVSVEDVERLRLTATRLVVDAHHGENMRGRAEQVLTARFSDLCAIKPDGSRLANLRPLVIPTIGDRELESALRDIARGDGNEMLWERKEQALRPPALHSIFSSCGLALNAFGPWRVKPESLELLGESNYRELRFEVKLRIFPDGRRSPNLDVVLSDSERLTAVESKLTEHLTGGQHAAFKPSYEEVISRAHESWQTLYERLKRAPDAFNYLDAAQLVRHYLGIKTQTASGGAHAGKRPVLVYLYWEPSNAAELQPCRTHAEEIRDLATHVKDPDLSFRVLTYRELWDAWMIRSEPPWVAEHVKWLEDRYAVSMPPSTDLS